MKPSEPSSFVVARSVEDKRLRRKDRLVESEGWIHSQEGDADRGHLRSLDYEGEEMIQWVDMEEVQELGSGHRKKVEVHSYVVDLRRAHFPSPVGCYNAGLPPPPSSSSLLARAHTVVPSEFDEDGIHAEVLCVVPRKVGVNRRAHMVIAVPNVFDGLDLTDSLDLRKGSLRRGMCGEEEGAAQDEDALMEDCYSMIPTFDVFDRVVAHGPS